MKIEVNGQSKTFWLAYPDCWESASGHEILIGEYRFSAVVTKSGILVSEVTTGMQVKLFPHNFLTAIMGETREGTLDYYEIFIAPVVATAIKNHPDWKGSLEKARAQVKASIGDMPAIEDFDDTLFTAPVSEFKN